MAVPLHDQTHQTKGIRKKYKERKVKNSINEVRINKKKQGKRNKEKPRNKQIISTGNLIAKEPCICQDMKFITGVIGPRFYGF